MKKHFLLVNEMYIHIKHFIGIHRRLIALMQLMVILNKLQNLQAEASKVSIEELISRSNKRYNLCGSLPLSNILLVNKKQIAA